MSWLPYQLTLAVYEIQILIPLGAMVITIFHALYTFSFSLILIWDLYVIILFQIHFDLLVQEKM